MTYELRDFSQTAVDTALSGAILAGDTTMTIDATTGWPSGGANGPFLAMIDYDIAGKELVLITSRTGNTLQNVSRGQGGTTAAGHGAGAKIRPVHTARDADEANYAVSQTVGKITTKGDALVATAANTFGRLPVGADNLVLIADSSTATGWRWGTLAAASLGTDSVTATQIATNAVGALELADNAVDTNAIAALAVTAAKIANDAITATQIAPNAITSSELADDAVDTAAIAALAVTSAELGANAVIAGKIAAGAVSETADIADAIITLAKFASEAATDFSASLTLDNVVLGVGGVKWAHYIKLGRLVVYIGGFKLGTGGDVTGALAFNLPFVAAKLTPAGLGHRGGLVAARTVGGANAASGLGAIDDATGKVVSITSAFQSFTWGQAGDSILDSAGVNTVVDFLAVYVATA